MNPLETAYVTLVNFIPILVIWSVCMFLFWKAGGMKMFEAWADRLEALDNLVEREKREKRE